MANVILAGLDPQIARQIQRALAADNHQISITAFPASVAEFTGAHLVFIAEDNRAYVRLLREARQSIPVVVVGRLPDTTAWLDALEAGAADYCAAPIEAVHVRWILQSALRSRRSVAA